MNDIGLLLPEKASTVEAVRDVFRKCGLPLSGLYAPQNQRDLGNELVHHFLRCQRKPAPIMAIAALLTSPLMPWSLEEGHTMAQTVMDRDVLLRKTTVTPAARRLKPE